MTAVLDAGALIAVDRRDRAVGAMLRVLQTDGVPVRTSAGAVAQVWRDGRRQASLARILSGLDIAAIDEASCRTVGDLLRANKTADVVDAHVALLVPPGGTILTTDERDVRALLRNRGVAATVVPL